MRSIAKLLATIPLLVAFTPMTYAQFDSGGAPASAEETKPGGSNWLSRSGSYDLQPATGVSAHPVTISRLTTAKAREQFP